MPTMLPLCIIHFLSYNMTWPKEMNCENFSDDSDTCLWSTGNGQDKQVRCFTGLHVKKEYKGVH